MEIIDLLSTYSEKEIYDSLYKELGYKERVPTIDEFIESDEYLGEITNNGKGIYDYWREVLREIYPTPFTSPYHTLLYRGAIGTGKSVNGKICTLYNIMKMMKLQDARAKFNLLPTVSLEFFVYAADLNMVDALVMGELSQWLNTSEFFKARLEKNLSGNFFKDNMSIVVGSTIRHNVGRAIFSGLFEEIQQERLGNQLEDNYNSILARIKSRFISEEGTFGQVIMVGSAGGAESFAEKLTEKSREDPGIKIIEPPQWDVLSHKRYVTITDEFGQIIHKPVGGKLVYKPERFEVFIGDESKEPFIISSDSEKETIDPDKIIKVPYEYRDNFENDIYIAIRDLAGISTRSMYRFFTNVSKLVPSFFAPNWFSKDIIKVSFFGQDQVIDYIDQNKFAMRRCGSKPVFIHIDLGYASDLTGISGCHIDRTIKVERKNPITGDINISYEPIIVQDFAVGISRVPGEETPIFKIRDFIFDLISSRIAIGTVSTDGFQSVQLRQELLSKGVKTELISVDKTMDPYLRLKSSIYENRLFGVNNQVLVNELKGLRVVNRKVDHAPDGNSENPGVNGYGKDIADATCGAVYLASVNSKKYQLANVLEDISYNDLLNGFATRQVDNQINQEINLLGLRY